MSTRIMVGDVRAKLAELPDESVQMCVTSPPYYGLRDYGIEPQVWGDWRGSLGLEPTPALFIEHMVAVFREVRRVLRKDGTLWLNIGDTYCHDRLASPMRGDYSGDDGLYQRRADYIGGKMPKRSGNGLKTKDLLGIPWMLAFALRDDGWWLRSEITWAKRAPMPESVTDRPTSATEKVFLLAKSKNYYYDAEAVKEEAEYGENRATYLGGTARLRQANIVSGGLIESDRGLDRSATDKRNLRNWWLLGPEPFPKSHFATFPTEIPRRAIMAGTSEKGVCPKCWAPWARIVSKVFVSDGKSAGRGQSRDAFDNRAKFGDDHGTWDATTIGWQPTCGCAACDPIPATVLDPFFGAGTTGLVADQLGRDCIGIELNPGYAELARKRIEDDAGMFAQIDAE